MGLRCIGKLHIVALKGPSHKASERGVWHPESKNRSTVKVRFRHPTCVTIFGFDDQRFTPMKIFEAIKPVRNGIFMD